MTQIELNALCQIILDCRVQIVSGPGINVEADVAANEVLLRAIQAIRDSDNREFYEDMIKEKGYPL